MQRLHKIAGGVKYRQDCHRFRAHLVDDQVRQICDAKFPRLGMTSGATQSWKFRQLLSRTHNAPINFFSCNGIIQSYVIHNPFEIAGSRFRNGQLLQRDQPCFAAIPEKT